MGIPNLSPAVADDEIPTLGQVKQRIITSNTEPLLANRIDGTVWVDRSTETIKEWQSGPAAWVAVSSSSMSGFIRLVDTALTVGAPLAVPAGGDTVLSNNANTYDLAAAPTDGAAWWTVGTSTFQPQINGAVWSWTVEATIRPEVADPQLSLVVDIGGTTAEYRTTPVMVPVDADATRAVRMTVDGPSSADMVANGAQLKVRSDRPLVLHTVSMLIERRTR